MHLKVKFNRPPNTVVKETRFFRAIKANFYRLIAFIDDHTMYDVERVDNSDLTFIVHMNIEDSGLDAEDVKDSYISLGADLEDIADVVCSTGC